MAKVAEIDMTYLICGCMPLLAINRTCRTAKMAENGGRKGKKMTRHAFCICIYEKKVVPLQRILCVLVYGMGQNGSMRQ